MREILFKDNYIAIEKEGTFLVIISNNKEGPSLKLTIEEETFHKNIESKMVLLEWWEDIMSPDIIDWFSTKSTSSKERRLVYDRKEKRIVFQREIMFVKNQSALDRKLYEVFSYDCTLKLEEKYYEAIPKFYNSGDKMCLIQDDKRYIICNSAPVIFELWNDIVKAYSLHHSPLMFRGIHSCCQVSQKIGNSTFFHPYYVLNATKKKILLNVTTMKYIALSCDYIFPVYNRIKYEYYLFGKDYIANYYTEKNYILADRVLYNQDFRIIAIMEEQSFSKPYVTKFDILDVFEHLISIKDDSGFLRVLMIDEDSKTIKEIPYHHRLGNEELHLKIYNNNVDHIDLKTGKFVINIAYLRRKYKETTKQSWHEDMDDNTYYFGGKPIYGDEGYYNIDDASYREAFDDDAEAYWNID